MDQPGPSNLGTPQKDQTEWSNATTPSRQTFPRRLSLLQNETTASASTSPIRGNGVEDARRTSFTGGPKPLSLGSQPIVGSSTGTGTPSSSAGVETPRRGKRTSISYIPSPSQSVNANDDVPQQLNRVPSTGGAGRTRTGSISRAAAGSAPNRRRPSQASQSGAGNNSDAGDDWLMSEEDSSFSLPAASKSMAERDSAKVEALFNDVRFLDFSPRRPSLLSFRAFPTTLPRMLTSSSILLPRNLHLAHHLSWFNRLPHRRATEKESPLANSAPSNPASIRASTR